MAKRQTVFPGACDQLTSVPGPTPTPGTATDTDPVHDPDGAEAPKENTSSENSSEADGELFECAICLQTCIHPVKLPCSHIFCFLCVKGVAIQSKRCALCRQDIPVDYFNNPALLRKADLLKEDTFEGGYQWYYQGNNGWWQYDERASSEIEAQYKEGNIKHLEILIAGFLYVIDYENMFQYRRNDPSRRRKIKRDLISIPDRKGVAGLKVKCPRPQPESPHRLQGDGGENIPCVVQAQSNQGTRVPPLPQGAPIIPPVSPDRPVSGQSSAGDTAPPVCTRASASAVLRDSDLTPPGPPQNTPEDRSLRPTSHRSKHPQTQKPTQQSGRPRRKQPQTAHQQVVQPEAPREHVAPPQAQQERVTRSLPTGSLPKPPQAQQELVLQGPHPTPSQAPWSGSVDRDSNILCSDFQSLTLTGNNQTSNSCPSHHTSVVPQSGDSSHSRHPHTRSAALRDARPRRNGDQSSEEEG